MGNPTAFHLTPGQAHDLDGADALLPGLLETVEAVIADKAYDAKQRVVDLLEQAGVEVVIPSKSNATSPRDYDRHLIQTPPSFSAPFTSQPPPCGSFDDGP